MQRHTAPNTLGSTSQTESNYDDDFSWAEFFQEWSELPTLSDQFQESSNDISTLPPYPNTQELGQDDYDVINEGIYFGDYNTHFNDLGHASTVYPSLATMSNSVPARVSYIPQSHFEFNKSSNSVSSTDATSPSLSYSVSTRSNLVYDCETCSRSFHQSSDLKKHMNTHMKPNMCRLCDYQTATSRDLKRHITAKHPTSIEAAHIPIEPPSTRVCTTKGCKSRFHVFARRDTLKKHIRMKHKSLASEK